MGKAFLGTGFTYPFEVDRTGSLEFVSAEAKVQQSILVILGTARGERMMRPDFGSRLHELVFAPIDASTKAKVGRYVIEAIVAWEPRVDVLDISVSDAEASSGRLLVDIEYRVRATNSIYNLVYPFYLQEGGRARAQT